MDGPLNVFEASKSLSPLLTGQNPPFEETLNWLQFVYTMDRAGTFVAPASTVLAQSAVAEGGKLIPAFLAHLRRLYPKVCSPAVSMGWVPECRDFKL